ncbi:DUF3048 domain-containing protein [Jiangella ureilytica]|uniref:DUF3048 domain-containing protein n=1 Tax=Jiangella ureilytica TaxID=2530374 RepID=A0A4R4RK76_9ACTN|nr:DUF3048 domain-containing protein [Jiangella ureilytica]TDC48893.1 DUF3048 domain-containing protein [Jiangella ureilytica]
MSLRRRVPTAAACGLAAVLLLAACGGSATPAPSPSTAPPTPSATVTPSPTPAPVWPLTGLPAASAADAARPALVVKIDNTGAAAPQLGLSAADLVVEELVEGGLTRLAALYQSAVPPVAGPVRSVRTTDAGIALPAGGVLVASGGAERVLRALDDAGVTVLTGGGNGLARDHDREAPYNVMLDPAEALAGVPAGTGVPAGSYLPWGPAPGGGRSVAGVDVRFSGAHTSSWTWNDGLWVLDGDRAASGDVFGPATVLVLRVAVRDAGYEDPAGNPVPETVLAGSGAATLLIAGTAVDGQWSKAAPGAPLLLTDAAGAPLHVPPGRVWIELVPDSGSVTLR